MKERYDEFDLMKGMGIILVYLGHSFNIYGVPGNEFFSYLYRTTYSFHMHLFFFISGFLLNTKQEISLKKFYAGKIKRLLIPYLFINFIDGTLRTLFPNLVNSSFEGIKEVLFYGTKISWFVYSLLIIFIIFPFIEKYILRKDKYYLFGIFLLVINISGITEKIKIFSLSAVSFYSIYFYLGYILKPYYKEKISLKITEKKYFILLGIIFLVFSYKYFFINTFTKILFALLGIIFVLNISKRLKKESKIYNFLEFCGKNSLIFYLIEGFITVVYRVILIRTIPLEYSYIFVTTFLILRVATAYLVIIFIILKSRVLCFLFGTKIG